MRVGVAGLGKMGAAIAERLIDVGHEVTVWNRSPSKAEPLAARGATVAASPRALAESCETVVTILTDARAIEDVYKGGDGLLATDVAGKLFVEMSTVQPATEVALAEAVRAKGGAYVECPVGGTVGPARNGMLLGLAGGSEEDFARAQPLLAQLCRRVDHVGPVGAGASMKLAINLPLLVFWQSFGEAVALCRHLGLDQDWLVALFAETSGGPNLLKHRGPAIAAALKNGDVGPPTFDVDSVRKDLRTMIAEAKDRGFELPLVERTLSIFDAAAKEGWGAKDCAVLPSFWVRQADRA